MSLETLSDAIERLTAAGYEHAFRAERDGLRDLTTGRVHPPESMRIEDTVRFEGESDPEEEAILFALRSEEAGVAGTYTVVYGPGMAPEDVEAVRRLKRRVQGIMPGGS